MKKQYNTPTMRTVQVGCNNILCGSMRLGIDSNNSINNEAEIWSNQESDFNIWK